MATLMEWHEGPSYYDPAPEAPDPFDDPMLDEKMELRRGGRADDED